MCYTLQRAQPTLPFCYCTNPSSQGMAYTQKKTKTLQLTQQEPKCIHAYFPLMFTRILISCLSASYHVHIALTPALVGVVRSKLTVKLPQVPALQPFQGTGLHHSNWSQLNAGELTFSIAFPLAPLRHVAHNKLLSGLAPLRQYDAESYCLQPAIHDRVKQVTVMNNVRLLPRV